jgi:cilia- and flagella-associated protein 53
MTPAAVPPLRAGVRHVPALLPQPDPCPLLCPRCRESELRYLHDALAREAAEEAREREARERRREETLRFNEHLRLMLLKDNEDSAERDAMVEAARQEQEARTAAELAAREAARKRLMNEVDAGRQQQIADKLAAR